MKPLLLGTLGGLCVVLAAGVAWASPADLYGGLPRGMATAGTQTAAADDNAAPLYNPAGVALAGANGKTSLQLGYGYGQAFMHINRTKTDTNTLQKYPTEQPGGDGWYMAAGTFPLGGKIKNRASLGFAFYIPQDKFIRVESLDPKFPQWLRYQNDAQRLVLTTGLGIRVTDWLAVGVGAHLLATLTGSFDVAVDVANKKVNRRNISFDLKPGAAPALGFTLTPLKDWRFAFAWRGALQLALNLPNSLDLDIVGVNLGVQGSVLYTPHEFAFGAQYVFNSSWTFSLDLKYELWSKAPFPGMQLGVVPSGAVANGLGLDSLGFTTKDPSPNFQDTLNPSVSVEYAIPDTGWRIRGGYAYRPTYVPNQVGATNYLDSSAHLLGLGFTFQFNDPLEVFSQPLMLDVGSQLHITQNRTVQKSSEVDPVGNYDFGGVAVAGGATLRYEF